MTKNIVKILCLFLLASSIWGIAKIDKTILLEHAKYKNLVEKEPSDPWNNFNLAVVYSYMGKIQLGLASFGEVDKLDKNFAPKVITRYQNITTSNSTDWRGMYRLAFAYYFSKQKDLSLQFLEKIATMTPKSGKNAWAYSYMAIIYGERQDWDKAIIACENGLNIEPDAAAIHLAYAQALLKKGKSLKAANETFIAFRLEAEEKKYERTNGINY